MYHGDSRLSHLGLLRPVRNHCLCFNFSQKKAGEQWEGHSERLKQIQSKFSGDYFTEVAWFAGMWPYSTLYRDDKLYMQSPAVGIFSNGLNIFLVFDNILFLLFFNIISSVYLSIHQSCFYFRIVCFYLFFSALFLYFWLLFFANTLN